MVSKNKNLPIVVFGNRRDYFFTKICISSIRYYYPEVDIYFVKDHLNGNYFTRIFRRRFNVKLLNLGKKYYGWGASKIHFIISRKLPEQRYLVLDSDLIFIGKCLEQLIHTDADFVVVPERLVPPFSESSSDIYINQEKIKKYFPGYKYPGYFFNTGQLVVSPGLISKEICKPFFDAKNYPYYKDWKTFKTVDQSILNAVIPVLEMENKISVETKDFMKWSVSYFEKEENDNVAEIKGGGKYILIHYCGDIRTHRLSKMKGEKLLKFYQQHYRRRLPSFHRLLDPIQNAVQSNKVLLKFHNWKNNTLLRKRCRTNIIKD